MTIEEFNNMPFDKRYQIVAIKGKLLSYKEKGNIEERLFNFKGFQVKVKFDPNAEKYTEIVGFKP
ncbi:MAG: hypothetical protein MRY83_18840 [Flavobacteriales bacterium]|nr:hypothetical protein [Flavobacteriales bacterium]